MRKSFVSVVASIVSENPLDTCAWDFQLPTQFSNRNSLFPASSIFHLLNGIRCSDDAWSSGWRTDIDWICVIYYFVLSFRRFEDNPPFKARNFCLTHHHSSSLRKPFLERLTFHNLQKFSMFLLPIWWHKAIRNSIARFWKNMGSRRQVFIKISKEYWEIIHYGPPLYAEMENSF